MIKVIKIGGNKNYFIDKATNEYIKKYDSTNPNLVLVTKMDDGSILNIDYLEIKTDEGNQIYFEYGPDKYIIDDGYQNQLIRAGYLILNNYDEENILDKDKGVNLRKANTKRIREVLQCLATKKNNEGNIELKRFDTHNPNNIILEFCISGFQYTFCIDTINGIVDKNQQRKLYQLPFYPFMKQMDKYGTFYISIFCKEIDEDHEALEFQSLDRYDIGEKFLIEFINEMNKVESNDSYRFTRVIVRKRINYKDGI